MGSIMIQDCEWCSAGHTQPATGSTEEEKCKKENAFRLCWEILRASLDLFSEFMNEAAPCCGSPPGLGISHAHLSFGSSRHLPDGSFFAMSLVGTLVETLSILLHRS